MAKPSSRGALLVAAGILLSRIAGLIRMRVLAHFLGNSDAGDAFYAALKIPNFPQNLFGEGVLSASFIPVYANLVAKGDEKEAGRVAGAILSILTLVISFIVLFGVLLTPYMIDLIAPGFSGAKRELTIQLVRIIFPGTGLLVLSAWCLGILNSHHKFFLSYAAPVLWNGAIIGALLFVRPSDPENTAAIYASWGLVLGSVLQFGIQLPTALSLLPHLKMSLGKGCGSVREIVKNFVPVVIGRGVVQLSGYIDNILASFLPTGAVSALGYAQSIYMLPISLFGMSISAAELPTMSAAYGTANINEVLRTRIESGFRQIALFVIPSMVGFLVLGDVVAGLLFQTGHFDAESSRYVWGVLAGSAVGLLATTLGRLYSSAFYSLRDTKTPLRFSIVRVILTTVLGYLMGLKAPLWLGINPSWGTAGLTASAGIAGWVEFVLLRRKISSVIGQTSLPLSYSVKLWAAALISGAVGFALKDFFHSPVIRGAVIISVFGLVYFPITILLGVDESKRWLNKVSSRLKRK